MAIEIVDFPIKNGDFPIKNGDSAMVLNSCFWLMADLELIYFKHYFSSRIISMLMSLKVDLF